MEIEVNKIKKIYQGHYMMLLDFPDKDWLKYLLDDSYKYVWVVDYCMQGCEWSKKHHSLFKKSAEDIYVRNMHMDFIMETPEFLQWIPETNANLHILQVNNLPPYYLDLNRLEGKTRYDLLKKETDYLFEVNLPFSGVSSDYTEIVSPNLSFLNKLLKKIEDKELNI